MKTAAIVLDSWKLKIFKKHLDEAGFDYRQHSGPGHDCITLKVFFEFKDFKKLNSLVVKMNQTAANSKHN